MSRPRRRRGGSGPTRCKDCHRPIDLLTNPHTGHGVMAFDQRVVDGRSYAGGTAYPVEGMRAWRLRDLVEDLRMRRGCTTAEAESEAYAMRWQPAHRCTTTPTPEGDPRP